MTHHSEPAEAVALDLLRELHAVVVGECPSLLNEDSGGNADLAIRIEDALSATPAPSASGGLEAVREAVNSLMEAGKISCWMDVNEHIEAFQAISAALASPAATSGEAVALGEATRFSLWDQGEDAVDTRYSIFDGDEIVLLFNLPVAGRLRPLDVADVFNRALTHPAPSDTGASAGVKEAVTLALKWDERRNYIMPYRVRDKLRAALAKPAPAVESAQVADMAMLIRMLVRNMPPGLKIRDAAVDYLKRHRLQGSPLRASLDLTTDAEG